MANLTAAPGLTPVPQIEVTTPLLGGPGGPLNQQAQALLNRIEYEKAAVAASTGAAGMGFLQEGTGAVPRTVRDKLVEELTLADFAAASDTVVAASGRRLVIGPADSVTLNVPSQFSTIPAALAALEGWIILGTATIKVADGTYVHAASLTVNHPYGANIRLVGNETTPASCVIQVSASGFDCIVVSDGHTLGYLNGFKLLKTAKALAADNTTALLALNGARIICGPKVVTENWYYGIAARGASYIYAAYASVNHAGDVGIWAFVGSTIDCSYAVSNNASDIANGWGFGFQAEYGSSMNCSNASASGCLVGGIASLSNSNVRALSATASGNTGSGFFARDGGTIENHNATAGSNLRYGIEEIGVSRIIGNSVTTTGNTLGGRKDTAYFDNDTLGARLVANGSFRIDTNSASSFFFNSSGGLQLRINHTASAVNCWAVTGSAAGQPLKLAADGSDTAIAANIEAKGGEVVRLRSNGKTAFQAYSSSASSVNYGQVNASTTGGAVEYSAQGADANIDISIMPKGAGSYIRLGTGFSVSADAPVTGYITIKDSTGTLRKLAIIA